MNSIRVRVLVSYLVIIVIMGMTTVLSVIVSSNLVGRYSQISNNIFQEQALSDITDGMAEDVYNGFITGDYTNYNNRLTKIKNVEVKLNNQLGANNELRIAYRSVVNSMDTIVSEIEQLRQSLGQREDITGISGLYQDTATKFDYVKQNINNLILTETKNLAMLTEDIQKAKTVMIYVLGATISLVIIGTLIYAYVFSNRLTRPIIDLSETARYIAEEDLNINVKEDLLKMKDEIGSLSVSFDSMVHKLRSNIEKEKAFNAMLEESKKEIEQRNEELEKSNRLFVNRELKMIEMKKTIENLEKKIEKK